MKLKNLFVATVAAAGIGASGHAAAISFGIDFKGYVTMLQGDNLPSEAGFMINNFSFAAEPPFFGYRTAVTGKMVLNLGLNGLSGTATMDPILFFDQTAVAREIHFEPVATLLGVVPLNTLLIGNMLFDYGQIIKGIPVSIVLDLGNLTTALMGAGLGDIIGGVMMAPTENTVVTNPDGSKTTYPMGPVVVATSTLNTTDVDTDGNGLPGPINFHDNPSGTTPLLVDTVVDATNGDIGLGGTPIRKSIFTGISPNFDFKEITVTCINLLASCNTGGIPVPPLPLNPDPLAPLLGGASKLLKGLGL
jgi:hypothetical protein